MTNDVQCSLPFLDKQCSSELTLHSEEVFGLLGAKEEKIVALGQSHTAKNLTDACAVIAVILQRKIQTNVENFTLNAKLKSGLL